MELQINTPVFNLIGPLINGGKMPADPKKGLDAIETIAMHALNAIDEFEKGSYSLFDPSIGDESCQIRALMCLKLAIQDKSSLLETSRSSLIDLIKKINIVRDQLVSITTHLDNLLDYEESLAKNKKGPLSSQKSTLNESKCLKLENVKKGSDEYKAIVKDFSEQMKLILEQEKPINDNLVAHCKSHREEAKIKIDSLIDSLDVSVSKQVRQIILCYLVTKGKFIELDTKDPTFKTVHDKYRVTQLKLHSLNFDAALFEDISLKAKSIINAESIEFLREESKMVQGKRAFLIKSIIDKTLPSQKSNMSEVSFYHGCEIVMKRARDLGLSVLVKSRKPLDEPDTFSCMQLYAPHGEKNKYLSVGDLLENRPVLVIDGVSKNAEEKELGEIIHEIGGLIKMVRLNLSQHSLCTKHRDEGPEILSTIDVGEDEINKIKIEKELAHSRGFCPGNMAGFRIEHMYADTLSNQRKR